MKTKNMRSIEYLNWLYSTEEILSNCIDRNKKRREEEIIADFVKEVANIPALSTPSFNLSFESAFLHGAKSMVKFKWLAKEYERELCDLVVISTLREKGNFISQRVTFIQAKKRTKSKNNYSIDLAQLHLLSRFPKFTGTKGYFKGQTIGFRNFTETLGSFLLFSSDEFAWCSAPILEKTLRGKKSLSLKSLNPVFFMEKSNYLQQIPPHPFHWFTYPTRVLESCSTLNRFLQAWSSYCLGELWFMDNSKSTNPTLTAVIKTIATLDGLPALKNTMAELGNSDTSNIPGSPQDLLPDGTGVISVIIDL